MYNLILMTLSSILAFVFTQMSHPLAMGLMLLLQTLVVCLMSGIMTKSFWFSYILFLVFLGGLLVLFIYVTSLASNEMFSLSTPTLMTFSLSLLVMLIILTMWDPYLTTFMTESNDMQDLNLCIQPEDASLSLMKLYNQPTSLITLMLALYLFLTLIAVVKITKIFYGPLRTKN
uniref:NADH-ubiquinone oxidoreductase chain 6 n=1 Tax=Oyamia nigribasis TaxID=1310311 RepID=A0A7T1TUK7_9NEOP|nr:NADH dehydrogenase subunit 6 [Oyamia nigribasis]QPP20253.1 NADH dehydrogenase subunit 6 [Oyamia nigribasis]